MGLDAVELVMEVEDHFGISLRNTEAERVRTVGDLVALIQSRIAAAHLATCPTLVSFLRLRSCVRETAADDTLRIRPGTRVVDVLDGAERKRLWTQLANFIGSTPPGLRRSPVLRRLLACFIIFTIVLPFVLAASIDWVILPLTLTLAALVAWALHYVTVPFRIDPPDSLATFGAISRRMSGVTVATKQVHLASVDAILDELRPIVVNTLGVDRSEVTLTARFIEDLGMG